MIPTSKEVIREAIIVIAGAVVAALVMSQFPGLKAWIKEQWQS